MWRDRWLRLKKDGVQGESSAQWRETKITERNAEGEARARHEERLPHQVTLCSDDFTGTGLVEANKLTSRAIGQPQERQQAEWLVEGNYKALRSQLGHL